MSTQRGRRTVSSWIALFAILLVSFVPTVTGAFSTASGLPWDRICSAANVASDKRATPDSPASPHAFEHCPYCALHADLAPPPDPRIADAGIALAFRALPLAFTRAPRGNAVWASAQPRAPPRFV
ncbi:DUF2946 domain-containing protein [Scleromatobacter humisilvae]|uniref:DUF2946 domain-containing protein n=1 Tax=Scleromatobacter humisilvae TaxID=2897159 RepID=A0A9X2C319_9BURK|nr:DUF2946 domain-containing protein [Scleromatobacter humisilvae]MCK9686735.1 DUF2946 domain-containing protein [Scleromatobacter humisilvae]